MYFSGFMVGFLMGLASEVFHSQKSVPAATPSAKALRCSAPHGTVYPQQDLPAWATFPGSFGRGGAENATNNEPKGGFI